MPPDGCETPFTSAELELTRRDRIVAAAALAGAHLLETREIDQSIESALREIGLAADADRAFISPLETDDQPGTPAITGYAWHHPAPASARIPSLAAVPEWLARLRGGGLLFVTSSQARGAEKAALDDMGARSLLVFPLQIDARMPGVAGFATCRQERVWSEGETALLRFAMNTIGSILGRHQMETALRHRTEDLIAANAQLAKASRLKDEFLASMSHELRTPLNAILGLSEALQELVFGPLNDNQKRYLSRIEESGRHLLALINDILDLSKIEAGKLTATLASLDVEPVCQASLRLVREQALKKRLTVSTRFDPRAATVRADERLLKQMLVNLLTNAVKFTPESGQIGLEVALDPDATGVQFQVWDSGIGIAEENLERLFQPFVQLDSSLSRQFAGTGLGLSLVKRMALMHGGRVSVETQLNHGSRFTIWIPWEKDSDLAPADPRNLPAPPAPGHPPPSPAPAGAPPAPRAESGTVGASARPLILLAEDNPVNITMMKGYLEQKGFRLRVAMNGEEAVHAVKANPPDLVLMDVQMPGMDGLEATRRIKADPGLRHIPIITLTALAMPGDRERCLSSGADGYFAKPSRLADLLVLIRSQLKMPA